jgi:HEAT repeat protein
MRASPPATARILRTLLLGACCATGGLVRGQVAVEGLAPRGCNPRLEWSGPLEASHRSLAAPLRALRRAPARGSEWLAQLVQPGAAAIAPLFEILVQERVPRATDEDAPQLLSAAQRELVLSALGRLPVALVRAELARRLPDPTAAGSEPVRLATLRVLSAIGTQSDLAQLAALAPRVDGEIHPAAAEALRAAYAAILRRAPARIESCSKLLRGADAAAGKQLLFALGDVADPRALPLLVDVARSRPELAQQAIGLVARVGASGDPDLDLPFAAWLAQGLDPERSEWTRASLQAIGVLDDGSQVPALLEQLESPHRGLRDAALGALRRQSRLELGPSPRAWQEWHARESEWLESGWQEAARALESGDDARVAQALDAYAAHRLFGERLALDVLAVLEDGSPAMRLLACRTLATIGSKSALEALVEHVSDDDERLGEAAWRAACALSGQTLPRASAAAREALAAR